jgi:hypothetical protein
MSDVSRISTPTRIITAGIATASQPKTRWSSAIATAAAPADRSRATTKQLMR